MMKRIFSLMVAAAMVLCGMAMAEATDAGSDWYMAVLTDAEITEQFPYRAFADVNGDGGSSAPSVPVLFISTTEESFIGDEDHARLYACVDGEAKQLKEIGGNAGEQFYVNAEEHTITYFYRLSGEGHIEVYNLKDGELVLLTKADSYGPFHAPDGENAEQVYFQDDEPIDEAAHEALMDKYANEKDMIAFEAIEK